MSKLHHKNLNFELGNVQILVNTVTGRMLLKFPDLEIGQGNFNIGICHVYNSHTDSSYISGNLAYLPYSWNVNVNAHLYYGGTIIIDNVSKKYYNYIDSDGIVHRFIFYKVDCLNSAQSQLTYDFYYDESGSGLILRIKDSLSEIVDEHGNIMRFVNGRLDRVISGVNENIKKIYTYNSNGKLASIYDSRKPQRSITFSYSGNNLNSISNGIKSIEYEYDTVGKLIKVNERINKSHKALYAFSYNNSNVLESVYDYSINQGLSFTYTKLNQIDNPMLDSRYYNDMLTLVTKFKGKEILATDESNLKGDEIYVGDEIYTNDNLFVNTNNLNPVTYKTYGTTLANGEKISGIQIIYANYSTKIHDEKTGLIDEIFFDKNYLISDNLENVSPSRFNTLNQNTGVELLGEISTSEFLLDGKNVFITNQDSYALNDYNDNISRRTIKVNNLDKLVKKNDDKNNEETIEEIDLERLEYSVSMHIKMDNMDENSNIKAFFKVITEDYSYETEKVKLKNTHLSSWQYINIPLYINNDGKEILAIYLIFENANSTNNIKVSSMYVTDPSYNVLYFNDQNISNFDALYFDLVDGGNFELKLTNEVNITFRDLYYTYKSLYNKTINNLSTFDLYYNDCKKVKQVTNVRIGNVAMSVNQSMQFYLANCKLDANNKYVYDRYYYNFLFDYEFAKYVITEISDRKYDVSSNSIGEIISIKKYTLNGLLLESIDNDSNKVRINYDNYGNVLLEKQFTDSDNELDGNFKEYSYCKDDETINESLRELVFKETSWNKTRYYNGLIVRYEYYDDSSLKSVKYSSQKSLENNDEEIEISKTEYKYDVFKNNIKEIIFINLKDGTTKSNNLIYDRCSNVKRMSNANNLMHYFNYDDENRIVSYSRNNRVKEQNVYNTNKDIAFDMMTQEYEDDVIIDNGDEVISKKHYTLNSPSNHYKYYDKYGRLLYETIGSYFVRYTYESDDDSYLGSIKKARIKEIYDPFENRNYIYTYDDINKKTTLLEEASITGVKKFKVTSHPNGMTEYDFNQSEETSSDAYKNIVGYKEKNGKVLPKVVINYKGELSDNDILVAFSPEYEYNELGRVSSRKVSRVKQLNENQVDKWEYSRSIYSETNTSLVSEITDTFASTVDANLLNSQTYNAQVRLSYEYDGNYYIKKETLSGTRLEGDFELSTWEEKNLSQTSVSFEYDGYGRLVKETKDSVTKEYSFDEDANLKTVKEAGVVKKSFTYHQGILHSATIDGVNKAVEFDNYGNLTLYGSERYYYDLRGKLNRHIYKYNNVNYEDSYYYNSFGNRYRRETDAGDHFITRDYYYAGNRLMGEDINITDLVGSNDKELKFRYFYDKDGICGIRSGTTDYCLIKDGLGNVRWIMNNNVLLAEYVYDAWGNHTIKYYVSDSFISANRLDKKVIEYNPFRYKGYYYDVETQLFYCNSRYYSPELCRFISPDDIEYLDPESINGLNLYCYCMNNPIMYSDPSGNMPKWAEWLIGGAFVVAAVALTIWTAGVGTAAFLASTMGGGFWATVGCGVFVGAVTGAASGALMNIGNQIISNGFEDFSWNEVKKNMLTGAIAGGIAGGLFAGIQYGLSASKIANSVSGLGKAHTRLNNAYKPLSNVKNLANAPFGGSNIAKTIGQFVGNYNSAYSSYAIANVTNSVVKAGADITYFLLESFTSDLIGSLF